MHSRSGHGVGQVEGRPDLHRHNHTVKSSACACPVQKYAIDCSRLELARNINLSVTVHTPAHCRIMRIGCSVKAQNCHLEGWKVIRLTWGTAITLEAHLLEEDIPHILAHAHCAPVSLRAGFYLLNGGNKSSR